MKGATCYEYQIGRLCVRILRPYCYFRPYRHFGHWFYPMPIRFKMHKVQE